MGTAAATVARLTSRSGGPLLATVAGAGAALGVALAIALASGLIVGHGVPALLAAAFILIALWCIGHRRVDQTLVVLALYLGLLDGYVKLRTGSSTITLARDAIVIAIAAGALLRTVHSNQRLFLPPLGGFVVAFSVVVLVETLNPAARGVAASLAGVRQHLEFVPLFFLGYAFVRTESQIRKGLWVIIFCAAVGGVVSYIQSTLTPAELAGWGVGYQERILGTGIFAGAGRVTFFDSGPAAVRPFGLGSDMGSGAIIAALALPGLVALLMTTRGRIRWALGPMAIGIGLAVATSGSRSAIVTAFVTLLAFALVAAVSKNALKGLAGIAVGVVLIYAAFNHLGADNATLKRAQSITPANALATFSTERGGSVKAFGRLAQDHPLGVGVGTVGPAARVGPASELGGLDAETQWNFLLIETGILGVVIYVTFLLRMIWLALTRVRRLNSPELRLYLAAIAAPIFGMLAGGFSGSTSAAVPSAPFLWLAAGVLGYWLVTVFPRRA